MTFSEAVQNVNQTDFTVTGAGIGNPDVAMVAVTNTGDTTYDVTASGSNLADLDATVTLDFDSAQNIQDTSGNALTTTLPAAANTYEVDNTAPTVAITTECDRHDYCRGLYRHRHLLGDGEELRGR